MECPRQKKHGVEVNYSREIVVIVVSSKSKGIKVGFEPLSCILKTLFGDIYYNNLSFRLSHMEYRNIKFLHTKINESS